MKQNAANSIPKPSARVARFEQLGYGLFIHWGLYSQLGTGEWTLMHRKTPRQTV